MSIRVPSASFVATALVLVLAAAIGASGPADAAGKHTKAPGFRAVDLAGERFTLDDLLGRGPIVVNFWATWCKPCIKELPYIQRLHDEYEEAGVQVLAVTIDSPKTQSQVRRFVKSRKFDFRVVMDAEQDVLRKLQGKGTIPYVVILDEYGYIRYHHTGYRPGDEKELTRVVKELLAEAEGGEGRRLFTSYCQLCHGPGGKGDGPFAKKRNLMPADLTVTVRSRSDSVLRKIISGEGRQTITGGDRHSIISDTMPSWAGAFTSEQMDALIAYLRFLSTSKPEPLGNPETGIGLYQQYCQSCHGEDGSGDGIMTRLIAMEPMDHTNPVAMNRLSNDDLLDSILDGAGEYMPAWRDILSQSEAEALVSYIRLLAQ